MRRRDFGGEIIAAIAAVALLSFAITFGILLSVSDPESDESPTATSPDGVISDSNVGDLPETEVVTEVASNQQETTAEATATEQVVETEATVTPTTEEVTATDEDAADATQTSRATSETEEPSQTTAVSQQETSTATHTPIDEPSPTVRPSRTPRPSNTPTTTATDTEEPTETPTRIPSRTPRPTTTASRIPVVTITYTPSPMPTALVPTALATDDSLGILPTLTVTEGQPPTRLASASDCPGAPADWPAYIVQRGDTLYSIALAVEGTVEELSAANCIRNINDIDAGIELFVPRLPQGGAVQTGIPQQQPGGNDDDALEAAGCNNPLVQITSPAVGAQIRTTFDVIGTASWPDFQYYKLEIRSDSATSYNFYSDSTQEVTNGRLGTVDRSLFQPGLYWVRLVVVDLTGNVPNEATCAIPMIFE